jgi:uncharacterized membrane protein YraQ (UPF0718 family)
MKKTVKKIGVSWLFFISVAMVYLIMGLWNPQIVLAALVVFLDLLKKILPILGVVFVLIFLSNLILDPKIVTQYLGKGAAKRGWPLSIIAGIISMGPIYLWYPLLRDLKSKGMRDALIATFLYNRAVKIPLLPIMIYYLGLKLVVILTILMILFSILNGLLVERMTIKDGAGKIESPSPD